MAAYSSIQSRRSRAALAVRVLIGILIVVAVWLVYEFGRITAGYNVVDAAAERRQFRGRIQALEDRSTELKQEVAMLRTHREVDREAYREVEGSLLTLQAKIQEQQDAIAFYRGIVSPADGNPGLRVQNLTLTRGREEREFNLRLVLVQAMKHDRKVSGNVNLIVEGRQDGQDRTYPLADLVPDDTAGDWPFSFRYFQDFQRQLILPDGFTPERINVEVQSKSRSIGSIEESFAWAAS